MSTNHFFAKFLRFIGILLMGLTSGFTLLGGVGTTCVALAPARYDSMKALAPLQWLYILFVLTGIALGVWGIRATVLLIKGADRAYRQALYVLLAGAAIGVLHIAVSRALRGKSMPVDAVVYTTVLTLVLFLLFRIPAIWQGVNFSRGSAQSNRTAGGAAAILLGLLALTIQYSMAPTHTWNGVNYADAFNVSMTAAGLACLLLGAGLFLAPRIAGAARVAARKHPAPQTR
ncbi:MAG: hypothetical protein AB1894_26420 [Chloroflexota bacterium]